MPHYSLLKRQRNGGAGKRRRGRTTASWGRSTWKDRKSVTLCIYVFSLLLVPFTQSSSPLCAYINKYFFHLYPRARLLLLINAFSFPPLWTRKRPGIYHCDVSDTFTSSSDRVHFERRKMYHVQSAVSIQMMNVWLDAGHLKIKNRRIKAVLFRCTNIFFCYLKKNKINILYLFLKLLITLRTIPLDLISFKNFFFLLHGVLLLAFRVASGGWRRVIMQPLQLYCLTKPSRPYTCAGGK